jgi:hypothetical protein
MKSYESNAEMNADTQFGSLNWNHSGYESLPIRVLTAGNTSLVGGAGWEVRRQSPESLGAGAMVEGDCWLVESGDLVRISVDGLSRSGLPVVVLVGDSAADPALLDLAEGFVFEGDSAGVVDAVIAAAVRRDSGLVVRDLSDGTAKTINALSAEASRIADALARLAATEKPAVPAEQPVDATLIRRLIRLRRARDRYFPADIFADPAWDMLLDLMAAQLEHRDVPVSSLCIAAAVPTTTALRWIRSLSEAGLFVRRMDPTDARRTYISLSPDAAAGMMGWLRLFSEQFAVR